MNLFSSCRPRGMRGSASGRNLPLAVSMTTSQSSTPAAAQMARPPGRFESLCVCESVCVRVVGLINEAFEGQHRYFCAFASDCMTADTLDPLMSCLDQQWVRPKIELIAYSCGTHWYTHLFLNRNIKLLTMLLLCCLLSKEPLIVDWRAVANHWDSLKSSLC